MSTPFVDMMQRATEPPTTTPAVEVPVREPDVATAAPPPLPPRLLATATTVIVASRGPAPAGGALPATGGVTDVPIASGSIFIIIGLSAVLATCRRRLHRS